MNKKEKDLIGILKIVVKPQLEKRMIESKEKEKQFCEENNIFAYYEAGYQLGLKHHIEEIDHVIRWFEGNNKDNKEKKDGKNIN